jgi:hypothetical protein
VASFIDDAWVRIASEPNDESVLNGVCSYAAFDALADASAPAAVRSYAAQTDAVRLSAVLDVLVLIYEPSRDASVFYAGLARV